MGFISGIVKRLIKLILYLGLVVAFIVLIPNLPPYTKFTRIELESTQAMVGALAPNDLLNNAQALYKDKLLGPETLQLWNGEIYTGLATGEIVKLSRGGHVTFVTKIGQPCAGLIQEHICGRPLGFVIDEKKKHMFVADAYLGIWKVDLTTDKKQLLVSPSVPIDGRVPKLFNSVALDKNGDLYWTDSSSDFYLRDGVFITLGDPTGRLFHYNSAKNISKVLLDDLWFANGVIISPDNQFLLVAESSRYRILKYYIHGPKKGNSEVFVAGLPGIPDVLRVLPDGSGVQASLYVAFDEENPLLTKTMSSAPIARKFIARLARLIEIPFEFLQSQFPNYIFENIVHQIGNFASISSIAAGKTGLVHMDWNGNIVASYYNTDGSILYLSDAVVYNNKLYTGCPHLQNFIGAVQAPPQLIKAFTPTKASSKEKLQVEPKIADSIKPKAGEKKEVPKTAKTVTSTTPQPTTTQRPTTKSIEIPKETVVKQKTAPKDLKPESIPKEGEKPKLKEADIKQKEVKNNEKPKAVPKQEEKAKTVPKVEDVKPKVLSSKETDTKEGAQSNAAIKNQESQGKAVKEAESKAKILNTKDVKSEDSKKESKHSKAGADQPSTKTATKAPDSTTEQQNAQSKPVSDPKPNKPAADYKPTKPAADSKPAKPSADPKSTKPSADPKPTKPSDPKPANTDANTGKKSAPKTIPTVEKIPSDTAKPQQPKLKVITKSGPQEIPHPYL